MQRRQGLEYVIRVYEFGCRDLGRGWAAVHSAAGLGCFAVMAQDCVRVMELSAAGIQRCMHML